MPAGFIFWHRTENDVEIHKAVIAKNPATNFGPATCLSLGYV